MSIRLIPILLLSIGATAGQCSPPTVHVPFGDSMLWPWNDPGAYRSELETATRCDVAGVFIEPQLQCPEVPFDPNCLAQPGRTVDWTLENIEAFRPYFEDLPMGPHVLHLSLGANDERSGVAPEIVAENVSSLVSWLLWTRPDLRIVHLGTQLECRSTFQHYLPSWLLEEPRYQWLEMPDDLISDPAPDRCHFGSEGQRARASYALLNSIAGAFTCDPDTQVRIPPVGELNPIEGLR